MIVWQGENPSAIYWQGKKIIAVYAGSYLVWLLFLSCFGRGYWINELPWSNEDGWKNEPQ